jgi:pullulanase
LLFFFVFSIMQCFKNLLSVCNSSPRWFVTVFVCCWIACQGVGIALGESSDDATLRFVVDVPEGTTKETSLFMAGNVDALGPWQPNVFRLQRNESGKYEATLSLPVGTRLEYKFTRGSWASVEKSLDGAEITNRRLTVEQDATIEVRIAAWAKPVASRINTAIGDIRWRSFSSEILGGERRITVWLPPQFQSSSDIRFPVVYFLDGQNVFDSARSAFGSEWKADEAASELAREPTVDATKLAAGGVAILVAIDNSPNRMDEYTPTVHSLNGRQVGGKADMYLRFLADELKPWIDAQFPTLAEPQHTTLVGSSLGGLMVLHAMTNRSDVFGNGIAMSPSLFWGDRAAIQAAKSWSPSTKANPPIRLWIDMGTREGSSEAGRGLLIEGIQELAKILTDRGGKQLQLHVSVVDGAEHRETAWAERLPSALRFVLLGVTPSP